MIIIGIGTRVSGKWLMILTGSQRQAPFFWEVYMSHKSRRSCPGFTLTELIVVMSIIAVVAALTLPAILHVRESARQTQCISGLRQMSLALAEFHISHKSYPTNGGYDRSDTERIISKLGFPVNISTNIYQPPTFFLWGVGSPGKTVPDQPGSWAYSILPWIEQQNAYQSINFGKKQPMFLCKSRNRRESASTTPDVKGEYESGGWAWAKTDIVANGRIIEPRPNVTDVTRVSDGLSNTILLGEKAFDTAIQKSTSWYYDEPIFSGGSEGTVRSAEYIVRDGPNIAHELLWGTAHGNVALFGIADGSTKSINFGIDYTVFFKMLTPNGNETVSSDGN